METREYNGFIYQRSGPNEDWVAVGPSSQGGGGRVIPKAVDPTQDLQRPKEMAQIDQSQAGANRSRELLPTDLVRNTNDAQRSAYERDKAAFEASGLRTGRNFDRSGKLRADYEAL